MPCTRSCHVAEMLRSVLDFLHKDLLDFLRVRLRAGSIEKPNLSIEPTRRGTYHCGEVLA